MSGLFSQWLTRKLVSSQMESQSYKIVKTFVSSRWSFSFPWVGNSTISQLFSSMYKFVDIQLISGLKDGKIAMGSRKLVQGFPYQNPAYLRFLVDIMYPNSQNLLRNVDFFTVYFSQRTFRVIQENLVIRPFPLPTANIVIVRAQQLVIKLNRRSFQTWHFYSQKSPFSSLRTILEKSSNRGSHGNRGGHFFKSKRFHQRNNESNFNFTKFLNYSIMSNFASKVYYLALVGLTFCALSSSKQTIAYAEEQKEKKLSLDELDQIAKLFGQTLPKKEEGESFEEWEKRCEQFCFKLVLEACIDGEKWNGIEQIKSLIAQLTDRRGRSLFLACVEETSKDCVQKLINLDIAINRTDKAGNTALHIAISSKRIDLIPLLSGRFLDTRNDNNETALHAAVLGGDSKIVNLLVKQGLDRNATLERKGITVSPLALALMEGKHGCIDVLIDPARPGRGLHDPVANMGNVLHLVVHFGRTSTLKYLLNQHYKDTESLRELKDNQGRTALALASFLGDEKAVDFLVKEKKADINNPDRDGNTPLHLAVKGRNPQIIVRLISLGADFSKLNHQNQTPLQLISHLMLTNKGSSEEHVQNVLIQAIRQKDALLNQPLDFLLNPPENLVFQGGGPKGTAYVGALEELQTRGLLGEVRRVAGTSAGAITAALVAIGYSPREMRDILMNFDLTTFLDPSEDNKKYLEAALQGAKTYKDSNDPLAAVKQAVLKDKTILLRPDKLYNLLTRNTGLCEGNKFRDWIDDMIAEKVYKMTGRRKEDCKNLTFGQLNELINQGKKVKHLHVFATRFSSDSDPSTQRFSSEDPNWNDVIIADAIRCSMSIPGIFKPAKIYIKRDGRIQPLGDDQYVDGGLRKNFPIDAFDPLRYQKNWVSEQEGKWEIPNRATLGIALCAEDDEKVDRKEIKSALDLVKAIATVSWNSEQILIKEKEYNQERMIVIPIRGISLLDFDLTPKQKEYLVECGSKAIIKEFPSQHDFPKDGLQLYQGSNISMVSFNFVGRKEKLRQLEKDAFDNSGNSLVVRLLWGLGGVGKSELARKFANSHRGDFSITWEFDCKNQVSLDISYRAFAQEYDILDGNENFLELRRKVHRFLESQSSEKPWCLIYDNLEDKVNPKEMFPNGSGFVLLTSRKKDVWENVSDRIIIDQFTPHEAIDLLITVTGESKTLEMEKLAESLEYFPLAISKAAHFIEQSGCTIRGFLDSYKPQEKPLSFPDVETSYKYALDKVWDITFQSLKEKEPEALEWLNICSYLNPLEIPANWIKIWQNDKKSNILKTGDQITLVLMNYDLIRKTVKGGAEIISLHHLIQEAVRSTQVDQYKIFTQAYNLVINELEPFLEEESETWKNGKLSYPHAELVVHSKYFKKIDNKLKIKLLDKLSSYLLLICEFKKALDYAKQGLEICRDVYGQQEDNENTAYFLNAIGFFDNLIKPSENALKYVMKGLEMRKRLSNQQPDQFIAESLNDVAYVLKSLGRNEDALEYYMASLKMINNVVQSNSLVPDHLRKDFSFSKIACLNSIAEIFLQLGNLSEAKGDPKMAKEYYSKSNEFFNEAKASFPSNIKSPHQEMLRIFWGQGNILMKLDKYQEAVIVLKEALTQSERLYSHDHIYKAGVLRSYGVALGEIGNKEGLDYIQQSYYMLCRIYEDKDSPQVTEVLRERERINKLLEKNNNIWTHIKTYLKRYYK